jgi:NAD(P)-dependent dehydrogenase (short-subunit alcohol dehydrogenase family)
MPWTTNDIPDLTGRVAVVTGANGGLGLESARALAAAGAHVVMAVRNQAKAATAVQDITATVPSASLELVALDLGSLESVHDAGTAIGDHHEKVDILMNNAGLMACPERRTVDGFEMQLGVNHLGHWVLTAHLLPSLLRADAARVVTVTSTAHHMGLPLDPANPHLEGRYGPWRAYGQSKLANFHFGLGLHRQFSAAGATAQSLIAHPGLSHTELQESSAAHSQSGPSQRFFDALAGRTGMTPARGALSQLRAATDPGARGGEFYGPRYVNSGDPVRKPILRRWDLDRGIATLWAVSERETGIAIDLPAPWAAR